MRNIHKRETPMMPNGEHAEVIENEVINTCSFSNNKSLLLSNISEVVTEK